jgi:hypothetical protein
MRSGVVLASMLALALAACGGSSLSARQLRSGAGRICAGAQRNAERIATPATPKDGVKYLSLGVAALSPEVKALGALRPPSDLAGEYRIAVGATAAEVRALRSAARGLKGGGDPVVEFKTLQHRLRPLEARANRAWESIGVESCASR